MHLAQTTPSFRAQFGQNYGIIEKYQVKFFHYLIRDERGACNLINIKEFLGLGYYTSELDTFLNAFDKNNPKLSLSQRKEIEKYRRIDALRDNPTQPEQKNTFWDNF